MLPNDNAILDHATFSALLLFPKQSTKIPNSEKIKLDDAKCKTIFNLHSNMPDVDVCLESVKKAIDLATQLGQSTDASYSSNLASYIRYENEKWPHFLVVTTYPDKRDM